MLAPHHQSPPPSIAEALVAGNDVCLAKLEGGAVADMSRDRCSAISAQNRESVGLAMGPSPSTRPGSPPRLPAARAKAQIRKEPIFFAGPRGETVGRAAPLPPAARPPRPCSPRALAHAWPTRASAGTLCGRRRCAANFLRRASTRAVAAAPTAPRPPRGGTGRRRAPARPGGAASGAALPPFARKRARQPFQPSRRPPGRPPPAPGASAPASEAAGSKRRRRGQQERGAGVPNLGQSQALTNALV